MATDPAPALRPVATSPTAGPLPFGIWLAHHAAGMTALALGALAFVVTTLTQDALWSMPNPRITVPFFVVTLVAGIVAFARREGVPVLAIGGVGLAAIAMVLGWFLVMAIIVAVAALIILILSMVL